MKKTGFRDFIVEIDPEIDAAVDRALAVLESGNVAEAEELMKRLVRESPRFHIVQYGMGVVHALKEEYEDSIIHFDKAIKIFPYFTEAWFNKSSSHKQLFQVADSIKSSRKVVELGDPEDRCAKEAKRFLRDIEKQIAKDSCLDIDSFLANMEAFEAAFKKMENGAFGEAIKGFQRVLEKDPKHVQSFGNLALCHSFLGKRQEAQDAFDQALLIDPAYAPALQNRALLLSLPEGKNLPHKKFKTIEYYQNKVEGKHIAEKKERW